MDYYTVKQLYPWLYSLYDPLGVYCYLIVGEKEALLYDSAYGIGDLKEAIRTVTDKPVTLVLGHGHIDHANGAYQFDRAFLNKNDFALCEEHTSPAYRLMALEQFMDDGGIKPPENFNPEAYLGAGTGSLVELEPGHVFDLGGLHAEAVLMSGHTSGSTGLLIREKQMLLDSDAANSHIWMFLNESSTLEEYAGMLEQVIKLDFNTYLAGHSDRPHPKELFLQFIKVAREASVDKAKPYNTFQHLEPYFYEENGIVIVFNERTRN